MSAVNPVITSEDARRITRGRTPNVPVEYDTAVRALEQCCTFDEAKYWSDKSDALAAWAKIHRSGEVVRKAKMLKLHAFRRMGELAAELNPRKSTKGTVGRGSMLGSGPRSLLKSHGLSVGEADAACTLSKISEYRFEQLLKNPVAPTTARHVLRDETTWHQVQASMMTLRSRSRQFTPAQVAATMSKVESENALVMLREITEWMDEFEQRLKKAKP